MFNCCERFYLINNFLSGQILNFVFIKFIINELFILRNIFITKITFIKIHFKKSDGNIIIYIYFMKYVYDLQQKFCGFNFMHLLINNVYHYKELHLITTNI